MKFLAYLCILSLGLSGSVCAQLEPGVKVKNLCRVVGVRDNSLVGYGILTGLAGTGDSIRSRATLQSIANVLKQYGVNVDVDDVRGRNVAAVMVTATLPSFASMGDKLDVHVTSIGDARSLLGGSLVLTSLRGPDGAIYALAQGPIATGAYKFDANGNVAQKNHPTAGVIPNGATIEREIPTAYLTPAGQITLKLHQPDFTTASRVAEAINRTQGSHVAAALDAGRIQIRVPENYRSDSVEFLSSVENLTIEPDRKAKIVVNERTGTVIAGGDIKISEVTISHGDLRISILTEYFVSQPIFSRSPGVRTEVVPRTNLEAVEETPVTLSLPAYTTVADLVAALRKVKTSSRDIISILQAMKSAGALYAELEMQ